MFYTKHTVYTDIQIYIYMNVFHDKCPNALVSRCTLKFIK